MHPTKLAPLLLCSATLLTACATTSGVSLPLPERVRTEYVERPIDRALFEDHGGPEIGGLVVGADDQTDAAVQVELLGAALIEYRCRLNAAGVALVPNFARLPGCDAPN